ncbi:hypothetical protein QT711_11680 [Sporosarcina saromensis]|uniref:YhfM-like domain-containing protein n=1 Tax=Sporosarcina saromensis TaxID=359365 RepID=A0ABU4GA39_9BACL|nr:hypothetical protein [Sporosarcina saromensis]MDW0113849.1 hypothetical protein [Sporosarcina saromensis]
MKNFLLLFVPLCLLLAACSQITQPEREVQMNPTASQSTIQIDLSEDDVSSFKQAVKDSIKEPGIVNMADPQFTFSLDDEKFALWITDDSGSLMKTTDTHTIYNLSDHSVAAIYQILSDKDLVSSR